MVSPSKAKLSRIASQQSQQQQQRQPEPQSSQQQLPQQKSVASTSSTSNNNKVKLVKGSKPLIHHRFYLDIERHQVATKIESTIKELGGTVEFFLSKTITHFITDKQQPVDSTGSGVAVVVAQTGEWNEENQAQASTTPGVSVYNRIRAGVSPTNSAPTTRSSLTNVANRRSQQPGRRCSARNTYHSYHRTPQQYNRGQYVNDIGSATSRTSSPCPPPASTTPTPPPATSSTSLAGHVRQQQQKQQLGATALASSSAGGGNSPSTAATPLATATLGFDGRVKPTQPAVLPRSRADAMLQRVHQQQQQQQHQQHQPHHQPSYHLLPSSPLKYNISSPSTLTTLSHSGATPIKPSNTPSPSTFNNPSSHHKQQPASPCYSPVPVPGTAGGEGWWEHVTRSVTLPAQNSPIQLASSWGTPIWSPEHALKFLRKVLDSVRNENHPEHKHRHHHHQGQQQHHHRSVTGGSTRASSSSRHAHHLHGRFLKVESISSVTAYRPFYQEFKQWPDLLLVRRQTPDLGEKKAPFADVHELPKATALKVTEAAAPPVTTEVASGARMTRKLNARTSMMVTSARSASIQETKPPTPNTSKKRAVTLLQKACETAANESKKDKTAPPPPKDCGYCEICRIEYDSLAIHVDSESHRSFVQNDDNFQSLDQLIGSIGEFGNSTDDGDDGGLLKGLLVDNRRDDCGVGAAGGNDALAAVAGGGGSFSLHRENNETDERLLQLMEVGPLTGKRRDSLGTATVKTTVTTTTTAAVDEQQIDKATELHRTIKATANSSSRQLRLATKASVATGEQQDQQWLHLRHPRNVKQEREYEASYDETKVNSSCVAKVPESDAKQHSSANRPTLKEQTDGPTERIDHDDGESTLEDQANSSLIKRAIASVIASFDADSDNEGDESDSLVDSEHKKPAPSTKSVVPVKKTRKARAAASVLECGTSSEIPAVREEESRGGKHVKKECIVEQFIDFVVEEKDEQYRVGQKRGRSTKQIVTGVAVHTTRRSSRTSCAAIEEPVLSRTEEAQRSSASLTTERAQESSGMFGRRSAIHHHPHNQLNHHKHQKHKSTLSALLLKQQQERQQQLLEEAQKRRDSTRVESNCEAQLNLSTDQDPCHDPDDHAAGMKVISDFRHEQQSAELRKFSSEVTGGGLEQKQKPSVGRRRRGRGAGTVAIGHHRRQQQQEQQQLEAPECQKQTLAAAMGLKASTTAMNKHHHHLPHVDGGNDVVGGGLGAKTRLAEAALLECEGLDPKNTKRISLGLRQNPKRANLNEDFTSLLDETLERSRLISSSSSSSAATTTPAAPSVATSTVVARKAQARIRQLQHKTKDKDKPGKRKERSEVDTNDPTVSSLEEQSICSSTMKRGSAKKVGPAALEDIKVRGIRWRAPSPASRPPVKSPLLYKVIEPSMPSAVAGNDEETADDTISRTVGHGEHCDMMASKSERKAAGQSNQRSRKAKSDQQQQSSPTKNGLIVKIRRVRQSELSLLNDEAENFMFPKKDESSSDSDTDDGRQTSSEGCRVTRVEAGGSTTRNNFSLDIPSSSELERSSKCVEEEDEENDPDGEHDEEMEVTNDGRTTGAVQRGDPATKGSRKRRKPSSSNKLQVVSGNRGDSVESEPSSCASSSSGSSFRIEPIVKRARFDSQLSTTAAARLGSSSTKSGRRKTSFGAVGVFDDGSDPPGSRMRFPTAPIQPTPVAVDEPMTSTTTGGKHSYDKYDDNADDDEENDNNAKKRVPSSGRGRGKKGRLRQVKQTEKENPKSTDTPEKDEISDSAVPLREDSVSSPSQLSTCTCYSAGNGSTTAVRIRGRGSGRGGSRRGRRGRGAAASVAARSWAARGRGSRMPLCGCRLQLLDATRMPPPASPVSPGHQDTLESRSDSFGAPTVGSRRSGASKTKTTPPASKSRRGASTRTEQDGLDYQQPHESSFSSTEAISGNYSIASSSSSNKGKEDGMGAVFKWINFRKRCEEIEPYRFAFERVPSLEPWYETFQRQDDATEQVYEYFGSTGYRKLPYEMGPLPALSQNCCILNYKVVACRKSNRTASQQSFSPSSVEPSSPSSKYRTAQSSEGPGGDLESKKSPSSSLSSLPLKKRKLLLAEGAANSSSTSTSSGSGATASSGGGVGDGSGGNPGNRIARLIAGSDRPRKSPREHASTLAILSLLSQQQHRKRAAAIKILTSPKKATTTTAQSLMASQEKHQQQDTDSNSGHGNEQQRPSSVTDRGGVGGAGGSSIKFERPLFPDSSYVNSRNLCKELDAFLSEELEQVCGPSSSDMPAVDEELDKRLAEDKDGTRDEPATKQRLETKNDESPLQLPLSPSVLREGVAIERQQLPVSKRDLLDVLQTVGREPPLSLKLVQRCETVVKKIVQFDRKPRSMLASNGGYGGAVIGLQLFDGTSSSALGCSGSGLVGGVGHGVAGCAGGSVLKKRINRTGWPTNKRKIGTRTRQQSRFLRPMMLSASSAESKQTPSEDVGEESVPMIKKEKDDEDEEEDDEEEEDHSEVQRDEITESKPLRHEADEGDHDENGDEEDDDEEDSGPEDDEEEDEEEEEEDDGETVIEMAQRRRGRPSTVSCKKASQSSNTSIGNRGNHVLAAHGKAERGSHHQTKSPDGAVEADRPSKADWTTETAEQQQQQIQQQQFHRRRSRKSSSSSNAAAVAVAGSSDCVAGERKAESALQQAPPAQDAADQRRPPIGPSFYDTMPTLRAALMRDNSQQLQRQLSRSLGTTQPSPSSTLSSSVLSPLSLTLPPPAPKISPTVGQQPLTNSPPKSTDPSMQQLLSPGSRVTASGVVGTACSKYVTKTTTTMTRVDYTGGPVGGCGSNTETGGASNRTTNTSKPKRKSRDISRNEEATQRLAADDVGSSTSVMVRMNRYPSQRCSTTNNAIDDDDKECDSISSRSIFVSDDCDTTSSSTMVNAPPEDAPQPGVDRQSVTTSTTTAIRANDLHTVGSWKVHDESATAEDEEDENDKEQKSRSAAALQRSPRTPSERIRNKLVAKNRRMSALFKRRLSTTTTASPARVVKLSPAKLNVLSNSTQATAPPKRRGTTKPIEPVSLPPPSMMPLSPPLTTSTSSSSSSCADDKPMSPAVAVAAASVESNIPASTGNSGIFSQQPSNVKTRSASKGRPPVRRTYSVTGSGRGKTKNSSMLMMDHLNTSTIRLPYVSLVKTTFTGIDQELSPSVMTIANTTATSIASTTTTTASAAMAIEKSSPKRKGAKGAKATKQSRRAKLVKRGASSRGKSRSPRKQQKKVPPSAKERLAADSETVEEEHDEEEEEEDAVPIVKVRRRKQIIAKREDDERLDGDCLTKVTEDGDEHPVADEQKPTKRKQQLKMKLFSHGNHHYTYDNSFSVTTASTESSKTAQVERISNGILEHTKEESLGIQQQNIDAGGRANEGAKCHDSNVMSSEADELVHPDTDEHQLVEEHLIEDEHEDHEEEEEDEQHLLDTEDSEDDETGDGDKGSTKIEMLELMEVVENNDQEEAEDHHHQQHEGTEDYDHRQHQQQQQQDVLNQHDGDDDEDTFLTGDEVEVEEQEEEEEEDEEDLEELERSATRIMNNDHPYANSSEDLTHRHHQRYNHRHHHDHDHHGVTTDEEETDYVEVHELEAEVEEEEEEELDAMDEEATSSHMGGEEDHLHQLGEDEEEEEEESDAEGITQRTLHAPLSSNSHMVTAANSLNSSAAKTSTTTATATTTTATSSPNKYSPRKLRKPRGRWYRER